MPTLIERLNRPVVAIVAVATIAAVVRLWGLSDPPEMVFDENYYAEAACILLGRSDRECQLTEENELLFREQKWDVGSWVHPPLGKWMIAMGEKAFGVDPFGWRVSAAVTGTAVVVIAALMAQILFGSAVWTFVTGLLLAVESLNVVMSRVALLDVFVELWVVLGFLFVLLDRRWIDRRTPRDPPPTEVTSDPDVHGLPEPGPPRHAGAPSPLWRPWRYAAGLSFGAAVASKWSGALAILGAVVLTYAWETTRRRRGGAGLRAAFGRAFAQETLGAVLAFAALPIAVYLASYGPWFNHFGWSLWAWWENQMAMLDFHRSLRATALDAATGAQTPTHPYYSKAWTWLPMLRPVNLFYRATEDGAIRQVILLGSPVIFWGTIWTIPYALVAWWRRRDWRAGAVAVPFLALYVPWFFVSRPQFFFYILPATPFMVLAATYTLRDLWTSTIVLRDPETGGVVESTSHPYRPFVWGYLIAAVALFVWFWPVLTAGELSGTLWRTRIWFAGWI